MNVSTKAPHRRTGSCLYWKERRHVTGKAVDKMEVESMMRQAGSMMRQAGNMMRRGREHDETEAGARQEEAGSAMRTEAESSIKQRQIAR